MRLLVRQLIQSPGFSTVALLTIALGVGVNTAAFTALNRLLLRALPYREPSRLVEIYATTRHGGFQEISPGDYFDLREQTTAFDSIAAFYTAGGIPLESDTGESEAITIAPVTAELLPMLGQPPVIGRYFTAAEQSRHENLVMLSYAFWFSHFGGSASVLGRSVRVAGVSSIIVGVLPAAYDDPVLWGGDKVALWTLDPTDLNRNLRSKHWYRVAARLKPGVTIEQAQSQVDSVGSKIAHDFPVTNAFRGFRVQAFPTDSLGESGRRLTWLVMALCASVLAIACANLANLQLVRTTARKREYALRMALGCSRGRLVGSVLSECLILSMGGALLAILVSKWSSLYLAAYFHMDMPLDSRVLCFSIVAALVTALFIGLVPAFFAANSDVGLALKQGGRSSTADGSRHRFRQGLIVLELAMALTLLAGAGFFVHGLYRATHRQLGWSGKNVLMGYISLGHDDYGEEGDPRSLAFQERLCAELRRIPGVDQAVICRGNPVLNQGSTFLIEGSPIPAIGTEPYCSLYHVDPGFFKMFNIQFVEGRDFTSADRPGSPEVVIINETMARRYWPNESALGKRVGGADPTNHHWAQVVGVVRDIIPASAWVPGPGFPQTYRPAAQESYRFLTFAVHSAGDSTLLREPIGRLVKQMAPHQIMGFLATPDELMASMLTDVVFFRTVVIDLAALGLFLAALGIYGVVSNLAAERTSEIGIRMALGAVALDILNLFLVDCGKVAVLGTAVGVAGGLAITQVLRNTIGYLPTSGPWDVLWASAVLGAVTVVACWIPARRATKVDPIVALRNN